MRRVCSWNLAININEIAPAIAGFKKEKKNLNDLEFSVKKIIEIIRKNKGVS